MHFFSTEVTIQEQMLGDRSCVLLEDTHKHTNPLVTAAYKDLRDCVRELLSVIFKILCDTHNHLSSSPQAVFHDITLNA